MRYDYQLSSELRVQPSEYWANNAVFRKIFIMIISWKEHSFFYGLHTNPWLKKMSKNVGTSFKNKNGTFEFSFIVRGLKINFK